MGKEEALREGRNAGQKPVSQCGDLLPLPYHSAGIPMLSAVSAGGRASQASGVCCAHSVSAHHFWLPAALAHDTWKQVTTNSQRNARHGRCHLPAQFDNRYLSLLRVSKGEAELIWLFLAAPFSSRQGPTFTGSLLK